MAKSLLTTTALGPFDGVIDTKGQSVPAPGKLRNAKNLIFQGQDKISVRNGSVVALTLKDDAGTPASVTKVLAVETFMDGAVAVAYSSVTQKVYAYRLPNTMDGWYNAAGALVATLFPQPIGVLWTSVAAAPDVTVAEGLGTLYVASTSAIDAAGVYFPTRQVTFTLAGVPTFADLAASGTGGAAGGDKAYFTAIASFHQHLWGVGYGVGNTAGYTSFRPELGRFSQPFFGPLQTVDSIGIGDRVRALRERGVILKVAGNALFIGAATALFRVTGNGRDSWFVETLDSKYGVVGPKGAVAVGGMLYYWTSRGLARCADNGRPQPLWDAIVGAVATVANEATIVAAFHKDTDQVIFTYDTGSGVRTLCAFDTRRDDYASIDGDIGLVIACAGIVEPIAKSTATPPSAPAAPTITSTTGVDTTSALCVFSPGDPLAQTEVSYRIQGAPAYTVVSLVDAGVGSASLIGLSAGTAYEWRVRATRFGGYSAYVGPVAASRFTTTGGSGTTPPAAPTGFTVAPFAPIGSTVAVLNWTNADPTLPVQIFRSTDGVTFGQVDTASAGATTINNDTGAYGTFYFQIRHVAADGTPGIFSSVESVTLNAP